MPDVCDACAGRGELDADDRPCPRCNGSGWEPLTCRDCGEPMPRRTGSSGRQRIRCDECCVKHLRAYWLQYQRARRAREKAQRA